MADTPSPAGRLLGDLRRFDRRSVDLAGGARVALAVGIALSPGLAAGDPGAAASMGAGALLVGVTTVVGGPRRSAGLLVAVALGMGLSTFAGSATGELGWVHTALLVPWCLAGGLLMALGSPVSSVGTQAIAAMIVFGRFAEPPPGAAELAGYVVAGGALAIVTTALTRPGTRLADQRRAMASACAELAALVRSPAAVHSGLAAAAALDAAEAVLSPLEGGGDDEDVGVLRSLVDVGRRARLELLAVDGLEQRLDRLGQDPAHSRAVARSLSMLGETLDRVGASLATGAPRTPPAPFATAIAGDAGEAVEASAGSPTGGPVAEGPGGHADAAGRGERHVLEQRLVEHLAALAGQVRAIANLAARSPAQLRPLGRSSPPAGERRRRDRGARPALETLADQLDLGSPFTRHALRLTIVVTLAEVLAHHSGLQRGYWVALTASVVLRPEFAVTMSRGIARVAGTCLGVVLAGLLGVAIRPSDLAMVLVALACCLAACATFTASYVAFCGFLTGLVVMLVDLVQPGATLSLALDRLVDTAIGGGLALAAYGLWPSWSQPDAWRALARLAAAQRAYVTGVVEAVAGDARPDEAALRHRSAAARQARATAEATVARSLGEPRSRRIDAAASASVLAALRRVSLATHALRTDVVADRLDGAVPEVGGLAHALDAGLDLVGKALERRAEQAATGPLARLEVAGDSPDAGGAWPPLRPRHGELARLLAGRRRVELLLAETDEIVDALDTAGVVLGLLPPAEPGRVTLDRRDGEPGGS